MNQSYDIVIEDSLLIYNSLKSLFVYLKELLHVENLNKFKINLNSRE
jgi:hypothetical protein